MSKFMYETTSAQQTMQLGQTIGRLLKGGEVIQLESDMGGGKTTFVKGLAKGLGSDDTIQSPTFIISAMYECANQRRLYHYDFYRLDDPGLMREQLRESVGDPTAVTVIEWGAVVADTIPAESIYIKIARDKHDDSKRLFTIAIPPNHNDIGHRLKEKL